MKPKQLAQVLVEKGLLNARAAKSALAEAPANAGFSDWLVGQGGVQEVDLLRVLAQADDVRFISSARLSGLRVSRDALDRLPIEMVQKFDALPIGYDSAKKVLTVAMADPSKVLALDDAPDVARLNDVVAVVALPSVIRAAVARLYGLSGKKKDKPKKRPPAGKCASCRQPYEEDQLECAHCGLLLNADATGERTGPSIVRALLSSPTGERKLTERLDKIEGPTRRGFAVTISDTSIPAQTGRLDFARSLAEAEAFLVTCVDGVTSVAGLSKSTGLMAVEVRSILASLVERDILRLDPRPTDEESVTEPIGIPLLADLDVPSPSPLARKPVPAPKPARAALPREPLPPPVPTPAGVATPIAPVAPNARPPLSVREQRMQEMLAGLKPASARAPLDPAPAVPPAAPRSYDATLSKAAAMEKRGDVAGAVRLLTEGIARSMRPAPLYNRLAVLILNRLRDARQAEGLLQKAIKLEPSNEVYRQNLIKVLARLA